ncbi:hypothetical protein AC1031_011036 [Aphanomyces cochlioides]|nr:hypothetical protein AC1031_011036 [Aphanomyces cochlioides]
MAKSITTHIVQYQEDIRRTASFLLVDFNIEIVGSVDDLMEDMQAMMDKLGKMDYYISLAQSNVTPNRQVDNLLEMAIQLQRGLDHYYHNIDLRNVQANHTFEASVLASFDKEWMLASEDVVYDPNNKSTFLGQDASAAVYLGQYKGRNVAIKHFNTIKVADSAEFEASIRKEIKAWRDVANKPHILTLIGVCTKIASPIVVCESITRYIRYRPEKLVEMVYQLAIGLLSLHPAGIIHRDIKGSNVLVREDGTVAIADFGLSRSTESLLTQYSNAGRFVGTLNWISPEQRFSPRKVIVQSDVWSLCMTVWQLMTGELPYRDYCQEEIEEAIRSQDDRPGRPEDLQKDYVIPPDAQHQEDDRHDGQTLQLNDLATHLVDEEDGGVVTRQTDQGDGQVLERNSLKVLLAPTTVKILAVNKFWAQNTMSNKNHVPPVPNKLLP